MFMPSTLGRAVLSALDDTLENASGSWRLAHGTVRHRPLPWAVTFQFSSRVFARASARRDFVFGRRLERGRHPTTLRGPVRARGRVDCARHTVQPIGLALARKNNFAERGSRLEWPRRSRFGP